MTLRGIGEFPSRGAGKQLQAPVGRWAMADVEHDHRVLGVIDLVQYSPAAGQAGAMGSSHFRAGRLARPPWIVGRGR
jgi:hypothetical protein